MYPPPRGVRANASPPGTGRNENNPLVPIFIWRVVGKSRNLRPLAIPVVLLQIDVFCPLVRSPGSESIQYPAGRACTLLPRYRGGRCCNGRGGERPFGWQTSQGIPPELDQKPFSNATVARTFCLQ